MLRVLVVDDQPLLRESVVAALRTASDLEVGECPCIESGFSELTDRTADVLVINRNVGGDQLRTLLDAGGRGELLRRVLITADWISNLEKRWLIRAGIGGIFSMHAHLTELVRAVGCVGMGGTWLDGGYVRIREEGNGRRMELSAQEQKAALFVSEGLSNKQIAVVMGTSESNVKALLQRLFLKKRVRNRVQLARLVLEEGNCAMRISAHSGQPG